MFVHDADEITKTHDTSVLHAGIILCMCSTNERWRYNVTSSLIDWAHSQNDPCSWLCRVDSYWAVRWATETIKTLSPKQNGWCSQMTFRNTFSWININIFVSWMKCLCLFSMNPTENKSKLVQIMAWCQQAPSLYLNQCWPRCLMPWCHSVTTG